MKDKLKRLNEELERIFTDAESIVNGDTNLEFNIEEHHKAAQDLAKLKHASRGAAVTLLSYKLIEPAQNIRAHKEEYDGGFSARTYDNKVTVLFMIEKSLPRNVESHWLTQTISFAPVLNLGEPLKTVPKKAGPLLIEVVNYAENLTTKEVEEMLLLILIELIKIRNKDKVILTRPKNLPIDTVKSLIDNHFSIKYKSNAPRLPQIAIYAIYMSILGKMTRFEGQKLENLQRMKAADRKTGTVGDIVVVDDALQPIEAVEIKFGQPISDIHVCEAIEKVRGASVSRYYMLSTKGISNEDADSIAIRKAEFLKQNGCEIIVNGVVDTIGYYLRLLPNTTEFLSYYADIVESDDDTDYEHRIAWNVLCAEM
jgi:DNA (cytosine-5)-methyltransferase 1